MRREVEYVIESTDRIPNLLRWVEDLARKGLPGGRVVCRLGRPRRTLDQNAKLWPMWRDLSKQVEWHGVHLSPEDWKDLTIAALKSQQVVPGIEGGFVVVGGGSSNLTVAQASELIEFIYAFGSEREVEWSEPSEAANEWAKARGGE